MKIWYMFLLVRLGFFFTLVASRRFVIRLIEVIWEALFQECH